MSKDGEAAPGTPGDGYQDTNERDMAVKQQEPLSESEAFNDPEIDPDAVKVLPGTGGPDDSGETDAPFEYDPTGHAGDA
ncbi:MAG: hypothetical protein JWQ43_1490 [Glaciihabitans sp.]|nr:hypothetical protein [Glaciihabitans sp.]